MSPENVTAMEKAIESARQSIGELIASYERHIARLRTKLDAVPAQVAAIFEVKETLAQAGFTAYYGSWSRTLELDVTEDQLPEVYAAVGRLDGSQLSKELVDPAKRIVRITMPCVAHPFLTVSYKKQLPAANSKIGKSMKCKIVTVREPARVVKQLVCDV